MTSLNFSGTIKDLILEGIDDIIVYYIGFYTKAIYLE
jgi:hypothetical protein